MGTTIQTQGMISLYVWTYSNFSGFLLFAGQKLDLAFFFRQKSSRMEKQEAIGCCIV